MTEQVHGFSYGEYRWWNGVVEDRDDPMKIGRVKVRVYGYHPQDKNEVPTAMLPWAVVVQPTDTAGKDGQGVSPVGMKVGTTVTGYFADPSCQIPIVTGVLLGMAPDGKPDTNNLTRGEDISRTVIGKRNASVITSRANSILSGISAVAGVQSQIMNTMNTVRDQTNRLTKGLQQFQNLKLPDIAGVAGVTLPDFTSDLRGIQGQVGQLKGLNNTLNTATSGIKSAATDMVDIVVSEVNSLTEADILQTNTQIEGIRGKFSNLKSQSQNIKVDLLGAQAAASSAKDAVTGLPQKALDGLQKSVGGATAAADNMIGTANDIMSGVGDMKAKLDQITDLRIKMPELNLPDPSAMLGQMNALTNSLGALNKVTGVLNGLNQITGMIGSIRGLTMMLPTAAGINGILAGMRMSGVLSNLWQEPLSPAAPEYPLNRILETEGGLLEEFDSTPGSERYHRYHPAGTFVETQPDGTQSEKIVKDRYTVILGDDCLHVAGNVKVNIIGNSDITVNGNATTQVNGNRTDIVTGDYTMAVMGNTTISTGLQTVIGSGVHAMMRAPRIDLN